MEQSSVARTIGPAARRCSSRRAVVESTLKSEQSRKRKRKAESLISPDRHDQPEPEPSTNQPNPRIDKHSTDTKKCYQQKLALTFFSLPQELRIMIYTHVFSSERLIILEDHPWASMDSPTLLRHSFELGLLLTCRAIYHEAWPLVNTAPLTLTLDRLLTLTRRREEHLYFGHYAGLYERTPGHRWVGRLKNGQFALSRPAVPDHVFERVHRLELPYPERCPIAWTWGSGLRTVGLMTQLCHFQEADRPKSEDEVRDMIVASCRHHLPRLLLGQGKWPSDKFPWEEMGYVPDGEQLPFEIDPVATVWFLNTQRKNGDGWTLKIDSRTEEVSDVRKAWFERVPFDLTILTERTKSKKDQMAALNRAWKLSARGWKMMQLV